MGARGKKDVCCANCLKLVTGKPGSATRGRDIVRFAHCPECANRVEGQMEVVADRPNGARIVILRCRWCGTERAGRVGKPSRCMVCLDARSAPRLPVLRMGRRLRRRMWWNSELDAEVRTFLRLGPDDPVSAHGVAEYVSATALVRVLEAYERPDWTVVAGDVHGLPWHGEKTGTHSFGTWGRHEPCGRIQLLAKGRTECDECPTDPDSRTHRARADDPYLLYLVRFGGVQKFGRGYPDRVRSHLRAGATPVRVLTARHAEVVAAELALKREFGRVSDVTGLPSTFGAGTEVVPADVVVDLSAVLPHGEDVVHRFT